MAFAPKLTRIISVNTAVETTKGTDPGNGYTAHLPVSGNASSNVGSNRIQRDVADKEFGNFAGVVGQKQYTPTYQAYLAGGGSSDPTPAVSNFLQASALTAEETLMVPVDNVSGTFELGADLDNSSNADAKIGKIIYAGTAYILVQRDGGSDTPADDNSVTDGTATADVNGTPITCDIFLPESAYANQKTITSYHEGDGIRMKSTGVMGSSSLSFPVNNLPMLDFNGIGIYSAPTDATALTTTPESELPLKCEGNSVVFHTTTMTDLAVFDFSLDLASAFSIVPDAQAADGIKAIQISNQVPTGSLEVTKTSIANFDPYTLWSDGTQFPVVYKHGAGAGKRWWVGGNYAQITDVQPGDRDGIATYQLSLEFTKASGGVGTVFMGVF